MHVPLKFTNHRIEEYALRVTYRPEENAGTIIYNLSLIESRDLEFALSVMKEAHRTGITISDRIRVAGPGEEVGDYTVPDGRHAVCTMCSITLDALLLRRGIPLNPIGGGVVEIEALGQPFDPAFHEAIGVDANAGAESGTITQVLRRGYRLGDRVLRPALVRVAP